MLDSDTLVIKSSTVNSGTVDVAVCKISLYEEEKDKKNAAFILALSAVKISPYFCRIMAG